MQADRFLDKRKADPKLPVDDKWDDAVKSLLNYPDVVKMMSDDLDWTSALGEAVVTDQGAVIEAVQAFRRKAQAAGNLKSDDKQVVKVEKEIINIEPADPQVIYVPQYNPTTVVVYSAAPVWGYYPTPYPSYYYPYPPGAALATGVIWGAAIGAAWSGNRYGCCGDANINVNRNTNINTGNINRGGGAAAAGGRRHGVEVEQAARPGQQLGRQDGLVRARGRCARRGGRHGRAAAGDARRRSRWRRGRRRSRGAVGQRIGARQLRRRCRSRRRLGRRRLRRLRLRAADADGQLARRVEPQFDVRRRARALDRPSGGGARAVAVAVAVRGGGGGGAAAAAAAVVDAGSTLMRTFPSIDSKASLMNIIALLVIRCAGSRWR